MRRNPLILGLAVFSFCLTGDISAQVRGRDFDVDRRQPDGRPRQDDQWFDPGWWHDWPPDRDGRRPPRDRDDEPWFDPGWWYDWPPDRDRDRRRDGDRWRDGWRDGWRYPPRYGIPQPRNADRDRRYQPGRRPRAALGVVFRDTDNGVYVSSVIPGSPAQRAGLRRGDYLLAMDGRRLTSTEDATRLLARHRPGDRIRLIYQRRGRVDQTVAVLQPRREVF